jgi:type III restriction enzyme
LGGVEIEISGPREKLSKLTAHEKIETALFVIKEISEQARTKTSEFVGTNLFKAKLLREIFHDKKIKIDIDEVRNNQLEDINLADKNWYAQNEFYGTDEERNFIAFIDGFIEKLRQKYSDIALLRNEKFFQVFGFNDGQAFEPDFVMFLKKRNHAISIYQIFIEPKGNLFIDSKGGFENSKEGWKQKFLLELESRADTDFKLENTEFKLIGLPFYNEQLKRDFEEALENKILA